MKKELVRFAALAGLLVVLSLSATLAAQESNQAALVISLGDGEVLSRCVQFSEDQISGYDLISRTDLAVETDVSGFGARICQIEGTGCSAGNCFCECKGGGPCLYWSYWHQIEGEWSYSNVGAHVYQVKHGDIEGWVWDVGTPNEAPPPPQVSFEELCTTAMAASESQAQGPATNESDSFIAMDAGGDFDGSDTQAALQQTGDGSGTDEGSKGTSSWTIAFAFGLLLAGLVALIGFRSRRETG